MPSRDRQQKFQSTRTKMSASTPRPRRRQVKQIQRSKLVAIYTIRLIILGLGASTIAGTVISAIKPPPQVTQSETRSPIVQSSAQLPSLNLSHANPKLAASLAAASKQNPKLDASYLFADLDSGDYAGVDVDRQLPAASTIKLPIIIALFQDIDRQSVQLNEKLTIDRQSIAGGSGDLQFQKPGIQVSVLIAATKMMEISDNTATNLLIDRLGGKAVLNNRFRNWGLTVTKIDNPLPDLQGTNLTTVGELARLLAAIVRGNLVSATSRSAILKMMGNTERNTMLPRGLSKGAKIVHKTGDIGKTIADVGEIEQPSGRRYIASVITNRPYNDPTGPELIRMLSKIADRHFLESDRESVNTLPWRVNPPSADKFSTDKN